ncbi:MAG: DEAD/DEAH box helicase [Succinivibrio sp.]|nr:DEAD/DEAH box helicase [Succinivibrio sp.]
MHTQYGTTWWGQRWLDALSGIDLANRIPRGQTYANTGRVMKLETDVRRGLIKARVKGNYDPFYSVKIGLKPFTEKERATLISAIAKSPVVLARLSARELDPKVEEIAAAHQISIFPRSWKDLDLHCSCPDYAVPCKHLAAVIYKVSQEIDANPFIIFELRGLDIIEALHDEGIVLDEVEKTEMPSWKEILNQRAVSGEKQLGLDSLKALTFKDIPPILDSLLGLFSAAPAGYAEGDLREVLRKTLTRAAKVATAKFKDSTDRELPRYNTKKPLISVDSWGRISFDPSLCWTVHPHTGSGKPYDEQAIDMQRQNYNDQPLHCMFSCALDAQALEECPPDVEALYQIWLIATKLVQSGAVMPQIYEPIEDFFAVRWIPAIMSADISALVETAGRVLQLLPESFLHIERRPELISSRLLGEILLGAFIESYVQEAYALHKGTWSVDDNPVRAALFNRQSVDITEYTSGESIKLGLESWLSPLYLENLKVQPVIVFTDCTKQNDVTLKDVVDSLREYQPNEDDVLFAAENGETAFMQDVQEEVQTAPVEDPLADATGTEVGERIGFSADSGIAVSMGFNKVGVQGTPEELFIPLGEIINDAQYSSIRFECLRTVSRLSSICPVLTELLEDKQGEGMVSVGDLGPVILSSVPAMKLLGVKLIIPRCLRRLLSPRSSLSLSTLSKWEESTGFVGLADMLTFDWKLALGEHTISKEDFDELLKYEGQVVRFGSEFVYVDPSITQKIGRKLQNQSTSSFSKQRLIAAALSGFLGENPVIISQDIKDAIQKLMAEKEVPVPDTLQAELRPYQKRGFSWLSRNVRTLMGSVIADDMGLGKTLQVIACLEKLRVDGELKQKQVLVVTPTSILINWQRELSKFAPKLTHDIVYGAHKTLNDQAEVILTSYGTLRSQLKLFKTMKIRVLVLDEAQNIKNSTSLSFRSIKALNADSMIAMSGTPVENRLMEYWSIMDFANPGLLGAADEFRREFAGPIERNRDAEKVKIFKQVTAPFIMRRLKSDKSIISDLPDKLSADKYCSLTPVQTALYEAQVRNSLEIMKKSGDDKGVRNALVLSMIQKLKMICNSPEHYSKEEPHKGPEFSGKAEVMFDLLSDLKQARRKTLIFTQFKQMGDLLQQWIEEKTGFKPDFLHGTIPVKQRSEMVDRFQSDRAVPSMILSLKAAGTGLNLTAASAVIHYDLWWNPAVEAQATDRAYRIGQTRNVQVYRLICANTFEEKINEMINSKKELAELTVATGEKWIGDLSNRQIEEIFAFSGGTS